MDIKLVDQVNEAVSFINQRINLKFKTAIVLGTGLSDFVISVDNILSLNYSEIPYFPQSTVVSHQGKLIFGKLNSKYVIIMAGRFHYYEGYNMDQVSFGIRVLKQLGVDTVLLTNASGGLNENYIPGDIAIVKDHINLHPVNPLRGSNDDYIGPRFPDMTQVYDPDLRSLAIGILSKNNIRHHEAVYIGLQGPNLETPAESRYLKIIGGDIVGMSTVPEVIVARYLGLKCFVASVVSNACINVDTNSITTIESIIEVAEKAEPKLSLLLKEMLESIG